MIRILSTIKGWVVPAGKKSRTIKFGVFKRLKMNLDLRSQTQVLLGLSERELFSPLRELSRDIKTGIDVGAAEGEFTLYFLSQPEMKHVLAFDPTESFPAELSGNLALNNLGEDRRVVLLKKFVSNIEDQNHCMLDTVAGNLEGPCLVKIDVEGAEGLVLQGARKLLERKDVSWIIETHSADLERECEKTFKANGLTTRIIKNAWWRAFIPEKRLLPHNRWLIAWHSPQE